LAAERELLRITLASIGDAVISTDAEGRVKFLNGVAEELTGWRQADAVGRHLDDIFHIVNETTREQVPCPVRKVLATGRAVGLANHTVIIARDGTERAIDDSAAPIRDEAGTLLGVVLIFRDISEKRRAEREAAERARLAVLGADIGLALTRNDSLPEMLDSCAKALVARLDAALARIWTLNETGNILELQASAGMYTHLNGPHGRVPVGKFKIGLIAQERKSHLTNAVIGDPLVPEQEWAQREGLVAFAGAPLIVADKLVGVMAMFARRPLSATAHQALASVANEIAIGIGRKRDEAQLRASEERLRLALESAELGSWHVDLTTMALS
jgi:PAS domain S-box-containing protein